MDAASVLKTRLARASSSVSKPGGNRLALMYRISGDILSALATCLMKWSERGFRRPFSISERYLNEIGLPFSFNSIEASCFCVSIFSWRFRAMYCPKVIGKLRMKSLYQRIDSRILPQCAVSCKQFRKEIYINAQSCNCTYILVRKFKGSPLAGNSRAGFFRLVG